MKAAIKVDTPANGDYFSPLEVVRGSVALRGCTGQLGNIPNICVSLQGEIKLSFMPTTGLENEDDSVFPMPKLKQEHKTFLNVSQAIPRKEIVLASVAEPGHATFSAPFTFQLPDHAPSYCPSPKSARLLPPSLNIASAGVKIKIAYAVVARAHLPGLLHRSHKARAEFSFRPATAPPPSLPQSPPQSTSHSTASLALNRRSSAGSTTPSTPPAQLPLAAGEQLPAYSPTPPTPILTLELAMVGNPPILAARSPNPPLRIRLRTTPGLSGGGVQLRSITARLRERTLVRGEASAQANVTYQALWSMSGCRALNMEGDAAEMEVSDCGIWGWGECLVGLLPSFRSCFVERGYAVEVIVGFSSSARRDTQYLDAALDVVVVEPPPKYDS